MVTFVYVRTYSRSSGTGVYIEEEHAHNTLFKLYILYVHVTLLP